MNDALRIRPADLKPALVALVLAALLAPATAPANELAGSARASGFNVHDAAQTLRDYCHWDAGKLYFTVPGGATWELVTSTSDPAITNAGDGQFHPFAVNEVEAALAGVRFPLARVSAEVFILPYPRRAGLESAAGPGLILLSPGVLALPAEQQHAEFTHELGHVVQYALMPDTDTLGWARYREPPARDLRRGLPRAVRRRAGELLELDRKRRDPLPGGGERPRRVRAGPCRRADRREPADRRARWRARRGDAVA